MKVKKNWVEVDKKVDGGSLKKWMKVHEKWMKVDEKSG